MNKVLVCFGYVKSSFLRTGPAHFIFVGYPTTPHSYCVQVRNCCLANIISLKIYLFAYTIPYYLCTKYHTPVPQVLYLMQLQRTFINLTRLQFRHSTFQTKCYLNKSSIICQNILPYIISGTYSKGH